jgi:hypothetical protein
VGRDDKNPGGGFDVGEKEHGRVLEPDITEFGGEEVFVGRTLSP